MSTIAFRSIEDVVEKTFKYQNMETAQIYLPIEDTFDERFVNFDPVFEDKRYNAVNDVIAFIYDKQYHVIPNFFGIRIILEGLGFQRDSRIRVLFSENYELPFREEKEWLELLRDMYETNHTWSRESRYMPEEATAIDRKFLELSYVYSTRFTENIGRYNYNDKMIVFYYYDGKIYVTGDYTIIKELENHGFTRDETLEIPVLDK